MIISKAIITVATMKPMLTETNNKQFFTHIKFTNKFNDDIHTILKNLCILFLFSTVMLNYIDEL